MIQSQPKGDMPLDKGGGGEEVTGKEADPLRRFNGPTSQRVGPIDSRIHRHDSRDYGPVSSAKDWKRPSRGHDVYRRDDRGMKDRWRERKRWDRPKRDMLREPRRENTRESFRESVPESMNGEYSRDFRDVARSARPLSEVPRARMTYDDDLREVRQRPSFSKTEQHTDKPATAIADSNNVGLSGVKQPRRFTRRPGDKFRDLMMGSEKKLTNNCTELRKESRSTESLPKESVAKESVAKESIAKDSVAKDSVAKDSVAKDSVAKDFIAKDSFAKDGVPRDSLSKEISPLTVGSAAQDTTTVTSSYSSENDPKVSSQAKTMEYTLQRGTEADSGFEKGSTKATSEKQLTKANLESELTKLSSEEEEELSKASLEKKPENTRDKGSMPQEAVSSHSPSERGNKIITSDTLDSKDVKEVKKDAPSQSIDAAGSQSTQNGGLVSSATREQSDNTSSSKSHLNTSDEVAKTEDPAKVEEPLDFPAVLLPQEIVFNRNLVKEYEKLSQKVTPNMKYVSRTWTATAPSHKVVQSCVLRGAALRADIGARQKLYNEQRATWLKTLSELENESRMDPESSLGPSPPNNKSTQATSNNSSRKRSRDDDMTPASTNRRARDRHSRAHGDVARSEAEFLEILASLEAQTARDPLVRARLTSARIPDQSQTPFENRFLTTNSLVSDHSVLLKRLTADAIDDFTAEQHELFVEAYCQWPKEFGKIAHFVNRSFNDCVMHYYRTKKSADYKRLILQKSKKKRGRKPRKRTDAESLPTTPVTPSTPNLTASHDLPQASAAEIFTPDATSNLATRARPEMPFIPSTEAKQPHLRNVETQEATVQPVHSESLPTESGLGSESTIAVGIETGYSLPPPVLPYQPVDKTEVTNTPDKMEVDATSFESLLKIYGTKLHAIAKYMEKPLSAVQEMYRKHQAENEARLGTSGSARLLPRPGSNAEKPAMSNLHNTEALQGPPSGVFAPRKTLLPATVIHEHQQPIPPVVQPPQPPLAPDVEAPIEAPAENAALEFKAAAPPKRVKPKTKASSRSKAPVITMPDAVSPVSPMLPNIANNCLRPELSFIPPVLPKVKDFAFTSKHSIYNLSLAHQFTGFHESYERHS